MSDPTMSGRFERLITAIREEIILAVSDIKMGSTEEAQRRLDKLVKDLK